ncbi:MAG: molybdopterin-dependent oxidoreductase [Spirochaetaceae bacterium]|nr:molybdopterin-dependent oxidoreductase [Spirochaetaceae bacterium]
MKHPLAALFAFSLLAAACGPSACVAPAPEPPAEYRSLPKPAAGPALADPREAALAAGALEVFEYRGERLDSLENYRDNSIKGPQAVDPATYRLEVGGLVSRPLSLGYEEALALPSFQRLVTLHCVEGWTATVLWEGPRVLELLERAGADPAANTLVLYAADGYSTSIPLADLRARDMILAARSNGLPLSHARGFPFQLVAADKWGYKWIKWVTRLEVSADAKFRGFWEERGYSLRGELDEARYEEGPSPEGATAK